MPKFIFLFPERSPGEGSTGLPQPSAGDEKRCLSHRAGFLMFVIITVMLAVALLAFALGSFKQGAVTQLAKTIDQNRLALLAQAANNEVFAILRSTVNRAVSSPNYIKIRKEVFGYTPGSTGGSGSPLGAGDLPKTIVLNGQPVKAQELVANSGYPILLKSHAKLVVFARSSTKTSLGYQAYLEVVSQAKLNRTPGTTVEIKERRDVKLWDVRHFLDSYVLFVKNHSPDYNNPRHPIIIEGIRSPGTFWTRAFIGNNDYPPCAEPPGGAAANDKWEGQGRLWFDLHYADSPPAGSKNHEMLHKFFDITGRQSFPGVGANNLFWLESRPFSGIRAPNGLESDLFVQEEALMKVFESYVNSCADAFLGAGTAPQIGAALKTKCSNALATDKAKTADSNSAAHQVCTDFVGKANGRNYSQCKFFQTILADAFREWDYKAGYTDADSIWDVNAGVRPTPSRQGSPPPPRAWTVDSLQYCGISTSTAVYGQVGPYISQYSEGSPVFNPERVWVGKMAHLYGGLFDRKVLVEGLAYLRFFKIAYFDSFQTELPQKKFDVEPVPLFFYRYDKDNPDRFLNHRLPASNLSGKAHLSPFMDRYLMSRAIDTIPVNCLAARMHAGGMVRTDENGNAKSYDPFAEGALKNPQQAFQKLGVTEKPGEEVFRVIDYNMVSHHFDNSAQFKDKRVIDVGGKKTLVIDGLMYIHAGDLNLLDVQQFYGKGMIYLGTGHCTLGNLPRGRSVTQFDDSLRIYLAQGDFRLSGGGPTIEIEASLCALSFPRLEGDPNKLGALYCNGKTQVTIIGNLAVDTLFTDHDSQGTADNGALRIIHDPFIYQPQGSFTVGGVTAQMDPVQCSISGVRTTYSMNAGEATL